MLQLKPLVSHLFFFALFLTVPTQWSSLPSDICYILFSYAFLTALKTHLYKYLKKLFQILFSAKLHVAYIENKHNTRRISI